MTTKRMVHNSPTSSINGRETETRIAGASLGHVDAIVRFTLLLGLEIYDRVLDREEQREAVIAQLRDPGLGRYLLAFHNERPVGQIRLYEMPHFWDGRHAKAWLYDDVYVLPQHRGKGLLRAMHEEVLERARADGYVTILRLHVKEDNDARHAYERLGFKAGSAFMDCPVHSPIFSHALNGSEKRADAHTADGDER